ncbi:hypothetical protein [Rhizobium laguerreae]|uniref:hypothetical protein n=1 Tax=Rhizobium laguerreae TaxID=1076926 RepID=UPI001C8FC05D|nr:hypothetical protein [Rhizobium laguerreae]
MFSFYDKDGDARISELEYDEWLKQRRKLSTQGNKASAQERIRLPSRVTDRTDLLSGRNEPTKPAQPTAQSTPSDFNLPIGKPSQENAQRRGLRLGDEKCVFPALGADEKIVIYSTYEGVKPTSVNLGDETWVVDITVEPGKEPLYVILPSYDPMVWRFSGAIERVAKVVPTAMARGNNSGVGMGGSGVIGIEGSKVSFLENSQCLSYFNGVVEEAKMRGRVSAFLGRQPDFKASAYHTEKVTIPSMAVVEGNGAPPWTSDAPSVEDIEPSTVVAAVEVKRYGLLPGGYGIKQLLERWLPG